MIKKPKNHFSATLAALLVFQLAVSLAWPARAVLASANLPTADISVGPGCTYTSIGAAVTAASPGARLLIDKTAPFLENITITKNLTLQGGYTSCTTSSTGRSTIDGTGKTGHVLTINSGLTVNINNLIITHGTSTEGGGISIDHSKVTLDNSAVSANTASSLGGGIRIVGGQLILQNNTSIDHNTAQALQGGGIAATGAATISVTNTSLQNNTANTDGGAAYLSDGALDFTGWWDVSANTTTTGSGGAVAIDGAGTTSFRATATRDSQLSTNHAAGNGGALFVNNGSTIQLYAVSGFAINLSNNSAGGSGGAIYANAAAFFDVWGEISAVSNVAGGDGGVFYLGSGSGIWMTTFGPVPIQILANQAQNGGAILASSSSAEFDDVVFGSLGNGNTATTGSGGAISAADSSLLTNNGVFQYNTAALNGGAIAATLSSLTVGVSYPVPVVAAHVSARPVTRPQPDLPTQATGCAPFSHECSSFHHNTAAGFGGAIYTNDTSTVIDSTYLHQNQAVNGAAMYTILNNTNVLNILAHHNTATGAQASVIHAVSGTFIAKQVTIADNTGIGFSGEPAANTTANNTISWGNTGSGYDHIGAVTCSIGTGGGIGGLNQDPKFYGNGDYRPWRASPAIDACPNGLAKDLNNFPRPYNTLYDMGAYEYVYKPYFIVINKK